MSNQTTDLGLLILTIGLALGLGCSSGGVKASDGGGTDAGADGNQPLPVACRVPPDHPLNPCGPTPDEHAMRYQGTDFSIASNCGSLGSRFQTIQSDHTWDCFYWNGKLIGWDRIENTPLCDGRATAVVGDAWSQGQACLSVEGWTWILGFDPGPTTISVQLSTSPAVATDKLSVGIGFVLTGREIATSDLTLRYWYTSDGPVGTTLPQSVSCEGSNGVPCDGLSIVSVTPPRPMADTYLEFSFPSFGGVISTGFDFGVGGSIARADGALYDQSNDYSYNGVPEGMPTSKVTAYVKGVLIHGREP